MLRIRLARFGVKNSPIYKLFVADRKFKRDGRHVDEVGIYDPAPAPDGNKHIDLNINRIKYWLAMGAQPSDRVAYLLGRAGIIPRPPERQKHLFKEQACTKEDAAK